jgi:hypothetical protein
MARLDQRHAGGSAPGGRVQNIEPSPLRPGTAYVAIYRYLLGDFAPYIYRTDDYGKTWTKLTDGKNGIAADEPTRVVREDPDRAGLLYAGTEFGIYVSFDNGGHWQSFQMNLPVTPVTDIKMAHKDLVLSTQGRGFWILDNLTPLEQIKPETAAATATLFTPREGIRTTRATGGGIGRGGAGPQYPLAGAEIDYYLNAAPSGDVVMEVLDNQARWCGGLPARERRRRNAEDSPTRLLPWKKAKAAVVAGAADAADRRGSKTAPGCIDSPGICAIRGRGRARRGRRVRTVRWRCRANSACG